MPFFDVNYMIVNELCRSDPEVILANKSSNLKLEIKTYRSQVAFDYTNKEFKTNHQISPIVFYSFTHEEKHQGDCVIKGEFVNDEFNESPIEHPEQGFYNKIVLSKIKYLIFEAKPFLLPDMKDRRLFGDNRFHQVADLSYKNGEITVSKSFMQLTVGSLRKEQ